MNFTSRTEGKNTEKHRKNENFLENHLRFLVFGIGGGW